VLLIMPRILIRILIRNLNPAGKCLNESELPDHPYPLYQTSKNTAKRALIAMSGGVDSSVAARLMKEQGYDCIGATMRLYQNEDAGISREKTCCSLEDIESSEKTKSTRILASHQIRT